MDLKQLQYFVTIVEEGSISAAAKKLHMCQPPLSYQLKMLEDEFGVRLLSRGARRVTLTDAGEHLYKRALNMLDLADTTRREMEDLGDGLRGTLNLGTVTSSGAALLDARMIEFHRLCPEVSFNVSEGNTYTMIDALMRGMIEMAIVRTPFKQDNLECVFLEKEPMVVVATQAWMDPQELSPVRMDWLKDKPLILYKRFETLIGSACYQAGFEPKTLCKNDDARTSLLWAAAGLGYAIVPRSAALMMKNQALLLREIEDEQMYTQLAAVYRKGSYLSTIAQTFLKVFRQTSPEGAQASEPQKA